MSNMLDLFWRASWQGGLLILGVWAFCAAVKRATGNVVPAQARYWLFWIATLQLPLRLLFAIPVTVHVAFQLPSRAPSLARPVEPGPSFTPATGQSLPSVVKAIPVPTTSHPIPARPSTAIRKLTSTEALAAAYVAGLAICLLSLAIRLQRTVKLVRGARPILQERPIRLLREAATAAGIQPNRPLSLIESDDAPCPLLSGLFRPKIVLPSAAWEGLGDDELVLTLSHELAHLKRLDLWRDVPTAATRVLFYFHPLVLLAAREMASACEEACDLDAIQATGGSRAQYAKLLVRFAKGDLGLMGMGSSAGYGLLQRRLEMLKGNIKYVGSQRYRWALVIALTAVLSTPFAIVRAQTGASAPAAGSAQPATLAAGSTQPAAARASVAPSAAMPARRVPLAKKAPKGKRAKPGIAPKAPTAPAPAAGRAALAPRAEAEKPTDQVAFLYDADGHMRVTARFNSTPLRQALVDLFEGTNVNYTIKSGLLPDTVTCSLHGARMAEVLQAIFQSVRQPLTYRVQGQNETYYVMPSEQNSVINAPASAFNAGKPPANFIEVSPQARVAEKVDMVELLPSLAANQADVRELLRALLKNRGNYTIDPYVQGIVTLDLRNTTVEVALQNVLRQVDSTYRIEAGVLEIVHLDH